MNAPFRGYRTQGADGTLATMNTEERMAPEGSNGSTDKLTDTPTDDYDSPWKDIIHSAFPEFMAFFFAEAAARIDWTAGHEFLDTELRQVVQDAELGRRHADVRAAWRAAGCGVGPCSAPATHGRALA